MKIKNVIKFILCKILGIHEWTCKAEKWIKPEPGESIEDYGKMFCNNCGKESKLNKRLSNLKINQ